MAVIILRLYVLCKV